MKQVFLSTTTEFKERSTRLNRVLGSTSSILQNESLEIANAFDIDIADLRAPLDAEEMSRITIEDEYMLDHRGRSHHRGEKQPHLLRNDSAGDYHHRGNHYHYLLGIPPCSRCLHQPQTA